MKASSLKTVNMTSGQPLKLLLVFALPLMLGSAFQQVYTLTDTAVVGRVLGVSALSALGACDLLVWTVNTALQAFTEGFSIRMGACFGAGDTEKLHKTISAAAWLSIAAAVLVGAAMEAFAPAILHSMKVQPEIYPYAILYLRVLWLGIPFVTLYNYFFAILRALGNSRVPLRIMAGSAAMNIVLDILLVAVLKKGIGAAALATVLSQGASAAAGFFFVRRLIFDGEHRLSFSGRLAAGMLKLSIPMSAQIVVSSVGGLIVQAAVNLHEVSFIAGYTATYKLYGLLEVAAIAYGYGVTTFTSQNTGAGRSDRVRTGLVVSELAAVGTALILTLLIFVTGRWLVSLFLSGTEDEVRTAVEVGFRFLKIMGLGLPMLYTVHVARAFVQGIGKAMTATANSFVELLARLLTVTVFAKALGTDCVLYAEPLAWTAGSLTLGIAALIFLKRQKTVGEKAAE